MAAGAKIANQGEKKLKVVTEEGQEAEATFQIAEATRPLSAVSKICDKGNTGPTSGQGAGRRRSGLRKECEKGAARRVLWAALGLRDTCAIRDPHIAKRANRWGQPVL